MVCAGYTKIWSLAAGELVRLDGARGTTLRVTRGRVWLTQERDIRDVVLESGDVFTIDRAGRTVIEAQLSATVCVLANYVEAVRVPSARPSFASRLRDLLTAGPGEHRRDPPCSPRTLLLNGGARARAAATHSPSRATTRATRRSSPLAILPASATAAPAPNMRANASRTCTRLTAAMPACNSAGERTRPSA